MRLTTQRKKKLQARCSANLKTKKGLLPKEVYVLSVVGFFVAVGYGLIVPALPLFAQTFGVRNTAIGLIVSSFAFTRFASGLVTGRMVDRFGERMVLGFGLFFVAISSFASGLAQSYPELLIFRAAGGLGSSMFSVSAGALLMRSVPDFQLGRAQSLYNGGFLIGGMAGPAFGGLLSSISLRAPFFVYAITLTLSSITAFTFLHEKRLGKSIKNDQSKTERVLIKDALKLFPYRAALMYSFLSGFVLIGMRNSILPTFLKNNLHESTTIIGYGFTLTAVVQAIALIYVGRISDKQGRRFVLFIGSSLVLAAIMAIAVATQTWTFMLAMILFGIGGGFLGTGHANVVGDLFGGKGGQIVATWQMAGDGAAIIAPLLLGAIADHVSDQSAFVVTAIIFASALAVTLKLPETRRSKKEETN